MAIEGNLQDLSLASLIQLTCGEQLQARLVVRHDGQESSLYFEDGEIVHMVLGSEEGEEVIYELLRWEEGTFELEKGILPPGRTVTAHWSSLVLEGMRQLDETQSAALDGLAETDPETLTGLDEALLEALAGLDETQPENLSGAGQVLLEAWVEEVEKMGEGALPTQPNTISKDKDKIKKRWRETEMGRRRSDILKEHLDTLIAESSDVHGAVVVSSDGLVLASNITMGGHDAARVGAEGAALMGLGRKTLANLKAGEFQTAVLQGKDGWVIGCSAGSKAMVLGMTNAGVNLGMALLEMRDIAREVAEALG